MEAGENPARSRHCDRELAVDTTEKSGRCRGRLSVSQETCLGKKRKLAVL